LARPASPKSALPQSSTPMPRDGAFFLLRAPEVTHTEIAMLPAVADWSEAMLTSLAAGLAMFVAAIPKVIAFAVILLIGWFIANLIARLIAGILHAVRFNELSDRSGFSGFVRNIGV